MDLKYMDLAIEEAKKAFFENEVPIGCVIVRDNEILAVAHNEKESMNCVTKHAEILAIQKASKKLKAWRLLDCDMYVTLEPCSMCATAISFARIKNIYYAAADIKGGGITSNSKVYETDKHLWKPKVTQIPEFEKESATLLKEFFAERRKKKNGE